MLNICYALFKKCQYAQTTGLFPPYCVDFPCNPQRIAASNRLVWRKKFLAVGHISNFQTRPKCRREFMKFRALFTRDRLEQAALLLLPPLTSFYLMQFILGVLPWELAPGVVLANSPVHRRGLFSAVGGHGPPGGVLPAPPPGLCGVWGAANYFVALYRGTPVLPWDLTALGTAAAVSGSYSFAPTWPHAGAGHRPGRPAGLAPAAADSRRAAFSWTGTPPPSAWALPGRLGALLPEDPAVQPQSLEPARRGQGRRVGPDGGPIRSSGAVAAFLRQHRAIWRWRSRRTPSAPAAELDHGPGGAPGGGPGELPTAPISSPS